MSWFSDRESWQATVSLTPSIADHFDKFEASYWQLPQIPAQVLDLCRLRIAQIHRCDVELARRATTLHSDKHDALANWTRSDLFSDAERAGLEFAEMYAIDVSAISDAQADAVKKHFGDAGLVALVQALGLFYARCRMSQLWDLPAGATGANDSTVNDGAGAHS